RLTDAEGTGASLIKHGALYPVLRSLEASGLLESSVEPSVSGPPRKYYEITGEGRAALERWSGIWSDTVAFVNGLIEGVGNDQPGH
ncbi:PadR family transcriptional regulator, partial [Candidatus Fermentibacterales bacterium]|nr:PadR family transcriptional regulator [Candidatus Fermentibacterales bacterium]